jgi:hypothetical protein
MRIDCLLDSARHYDVVARHEIKELVRFDYVHGDIRWDSRSAITYPAVFVCAGLCAGTLGIGGGGKHFQPCIRSNLTSESA